MFSQRGAVNEWCDAFKEQKTLLIANFLFLNSIFEWPKKEHYKAQRQ